MRAKWHRCKMTPNNTNAERNIEKVASRAAGNRARIRNLRAASSRNQVSLLILVHRHAISRATPVGHHGGGTNVDPGPAKAQPVYYRSIIENTLSLTLLGEHSATHRGPFRARRGPGPGMASSCLPWQTHCPPPPASGYPCNCRGPIQGPDVARRRIHAVSGCVLRSHRRIHAVHRMFVV
jgi:hypothetical protein